MKTIGILFATREGQTRRIAGYVAQRLRDAGYAIEVVDVAHADGVNLDGFDAVVLASSVHVWRHEPEMARFVKKHRLKLATVPSAFLSVSLCEAGAEDPAAEPQQKIRNRLDAFWLMDRFFTSTHWHPDIALPVAGALRYSQYSIFKKLVLQQVARAKGGSSDTSRDHEYTDWDRVDDFVVRFRGLLQEAPVRPVAVV